MGAEVVSPRVQGSVAITRPRYIKAGESERRRRRRRRSSGRASKQSHAMPLSAAGPGAKLAMSKHRRRLWSSRGIYWIVDRIPDAQQLTPRHPFTWLAVCEFIQAVLSPPRQSNVQHMQSDPASVICSPASLPEPSSGGILRRWPPQSCRNLNSVIVYLAVCLLLEAARIGLLMSHEHPHIRLAALPRHRY
jgi:hypothetical protein